MVNIAFIIAFITLPVKPSGYVNEKARKRESERERECVGVCVCVRGREKLKRSIRGSNSRCNLVYTSPYFPSPNRRR